MQASRSGVNRSLLYEQVRVEGKSFEEAVRKPFMARDLCRADVEEFLEEILIEARGMWTVAARILKVPYKRFVNFRRHYDLRVNYRAIRQDLILRKVS